MKFPRVYLAFVALCVIAVVCSNKNAVESADSEKCGCGENEMFSMCNANPGCRKTCDNIDTWEASPCFSTKNCFSGCICNDGYALDEEEGRCVRENSCPRVRH